ncbi:SgcJ/EcaC family oxidoreductase [Streptomyces tirandamycinicus]|uniref:SgcJ/EcaC family oxidoreductase n=1 Tax=Streptomyces tirandamycinicus TaxID=2174846 RepID=A0A2S1T2L2_9ACTN|nr:MULTISPECIES: SgcJ/EcaC family oxidoreductase [Streptomyces]AWI32816.1 SgcJ/EcaC family oxidoreductase [Streptomyces tirandamycinicus]MCY0984725.1 SgcJ/EcaC family oxidoreductase [Streptomyces tirandamycinicus]TFE38856.1 SgcJ/EcaC family oxidoreductase [Streptomyces sp. ICN441]
MTTQTTETTVTVTDEDKAAIAALPQRIVQAWAAHDADAFAEVFTPDGSMIIPGVLQKGRESIRAFMAQAFQGPFKGTRVTGTPVDLRFANSESGILITQGGILAPGESEPSADRAVNASWVVVKRDGQWFLAAYQNSPRNAA